MPPKRKANNTQQPSTPTQATVKRQRVSRACDQCRAAREKCDGVQPQCVPCVSQGRPCTYEVNPKKRGVATGYIRTLELALAWVFDQVSGAEDALNTALAHENGRVRALITGKDTGGADRLHKKWRKSRAHRGIDYILSGSSDMPYPSRDEHSQSPDASCTEGEPSTVSPNPGSTKTDDTVVPEPPNPPTSNSVSQSHKSQHGKLPDQTPSKRLKLPSNHWRLLDIYFSYTHSWLPILEKQALFQTSYLYSEQGLDLNAGEPSSAAHAELWSALALASLQDSASSKSPHNVHGGGLSPLDIYSIARNLIPSENGPFQINHARALVLLALVGLSRGDALGVSLLVGSAIRIALSITFPQQPGSDKERQKIQTVLMACFILETILSVLYNTLPHLKDEDVSDLAPIPEDGMDQWEPWTACDGFGGSLPNSRQSRNPAFPISTFNQLYAIFRTASHDTAEKRRGVGPRERTTAFIGRLQQSLNPTSPFGNPMAPGANSPVPTFYIIRTVYLWAVTLADPHTEPPIALITDTLNQYQKRFGRRSIPSILSACLSSLVGGDHLAVRGLQYREQLKELVSNYGLGSGEEGRTITKSTPQLDLLSPTTERHQDIPRSLKFSSSVSANMTTPNVAAGSFYSNQPMPMPQQPQQQNHGAFADQSLMSPYNQRQFSCSSPSLPRADSIDMHLGSNITYRMANMEQPQHHHQSVLPGFGGNPDYDALLDDLASAEYTDAIDVDHQFMTNLGFAPDCDLSEIFTGDFRGV
ncbi:fungal-specific transcription factor domain-containing protein [Podospora fimiseda]|uniref:Fungal-specific transcription factor domain-containing protein n=1 Tax=Podospora fimiseda TaxID=252190 RepID=A0AAN7BTG0_9PEZI|nr:fungal-specific transcription factor domain-containing protein [Podospora fimiseda]